MGRGREARRDDGGGGGGRKKQSSGGKREKGAGNEVETHSIDHLMRPRLPICCTIPLSLSSPPPVPLLPQQEMLGQVVLLLLRTEQKTMHDRNKDSAEVILSTLSLVLLWHSLPFVSDPLPHRLSRSASARTPPPTA